MNKISFTIGLLALAPISLAASQVKGSPVIPTEESLIISLHYDSPTKNPKKAFQGGFQAPNELLNLFELGKLQPLKLPTLSRMKYFENQKLWTECTDIAPKAFRQYPDLRGWVMVTWINCSLKGLDSAKNAEERLFLPLQTLNGHLPLLDRGPWKASLTGLWLQALRALVDRFDKHSETAMNWAFKRPELLSTSLKNIYFERLQQAQWPTAAGSKKTYKLPSEDSESEMNQNLEKSWALDKKPQMAEAIVKYLNLYPSGRYFKIWRDRLVGTYNSLWDAKSPVAPEFLATLLKLEPQKLIDIAQSLHRRSNYQDTLSLCELALHKGLTDTRLIWMAGRSSLFLGQYEKAKGFFQTLVDKHSGTAEYPEGLFRLGLLHYRLGNPQQASQYFEKYLSTGEDKNDLNTRYWYVRSLLESKSPLATQERDALISDYSFSYYGLKLAAEKNGNKLSFDMKALPDLPKQVTLSGDAIRTWRRAQTLLKSGLWLEAGQEIRELPWSQNPSLQLAWAQWLAKNRQWPPAIRLVNQAFENSPDLKNWELMKNFFPQDYINVIKAEAERRNIHPRLIQSLIRQESAFGIKAVSTSNAMGLMQMIPPTAQDIARQMKLSVQLPDDMYSPLVNIPMGVFYVSQMLEEFGNHVPLALAAYNAGPTRVKLWLNSRSDTKDLMSKFSTDPRDEIWFDELPWAETSFYIKSILRNVLLYQLSDEKTLDLKPAFWTELITKNSPSQSPL